MAPDNVGVMAMNNTAGTLFGCSRQPGHRTEAGGTAPQYTASMRPANEVLVLIAGVVPVAVDGVVVWAGAGPAPCCQVSLSAKKRHSAAST